jgi:hypothetical protein
MSEITLESALNHCIDQLARGSSVEDCLRLYPHFASELRPMLEAGLLARRAQYNALEVSAAQNRARSRVVAAMMGQRAASSQRPSSLAWQRLAAAFVVLLVVMLTLVGVSAGGLPGDPLYPLKRLTENVQLLFGDDTVLRQQFAQRRVDEINMLLAQGREAEVEFEGEIEAINGEVWRVAGLPVIVPPGTLGAANGQIGDRIRVRANTTSMRQLIASMIILLEDRVMPLPPTSTPTSTPTPTPTILPTPTATLTRTSVPDSDSDGLPDSSDLCPTIPGAVINDGCPLPTATTESVLPTATFALPPPPDDDEEDDDNSGHSGGDDDDSEDDNSGPGGGDDNSGSGGGD